jgi:hypothetical protein
MNNDRRSHEALTLRVFFDNQLQYLQQLLDRVGSYFQDDKQQAKEDRQIVEHFVNAANSKIRAASDYADKLRIHVRALYTHVLQVADQIPPPVDLTPAAFATDPLLNALFVNSKDIEKLFNTDPDLNAYLRAHSKYDAPALYALLTAGKSEKRTLGIGMQGDLLMREVPQQVINFSAHKIHTPCASSDELRTALKEYLFNRIVTFIKQEMASRSADQSFKPAEVSYESRVNSLANPDVYLDTLIGYLKVPADLLSIEKIHFKLNKLGILLDSGDDSQSANEFDIHELTWSNNARNVLLQIVHTR